MKLCKFASELKVDAIISPPPFYLIPGRQGIKNYFLKIAEKADLPTIIYNIPSATGYSVSVKLISELADENKNILGVKVTLDSLSYIKDLVLNIKSRRPEFSVLTGLGYYLMPDIISGGDGGIVALSNFAPETATTLVKAIKEDNYEHAIEQHQKLMKLTEIYKYASSFASAIKIALSLMGFSLNPSVRFPLTTDGKEAEESIKKILLDTGIL